MKAISAVLKAGGRKIVRSTDTTTTAHVRTARTNVRLAFGRDGECSVTVTRDGAHMDALHIPKESPHA